MMKSWVNLFTSSNSCFSLVTWRFSYSTSDFHSTNVTMRVGKPIQHLAQSLVLWSFIINSLQASVSASGNVESATSFPNRSNSSVTSGACQTSKSTLRSGKKGRGRPKGATGAKHSNRSKRGTKDCGSNPGSATVGRRITEMFKVVGRTRADGEAASQSSKSDASESAKVMPEIDVDGEALV